MRAWSAVMVLAIAAPLAAQEWKTTGIDADAKEPLLCVRADTQGQLFVGGRESLFVYEPGRDGYQRKLLYRFPPNSLLLDIETRGNDLYVLTRCGVFIIPTGVREREQLKPKKLVWGVPRGDGRQGFRAMAWGPEGDLYFTVGCEQAQYWTFFSGPDDTSTPYRGTGAVLRCKPDGTQLQVVARGLRHPDALVFDRYWNLFAADSDKANRGRLMHVTPHAFFGGSSHGDLQPMLDERRTTRLACLAWCNDRLIAGRGDDLLRLALEPRGASYHAAEHAFTAAKKPNALAIDGGGRLFAVFDERELMMFKRADGADPYDVVAATPEKLWRELGHASWQRRYAAHVEMTRRGGEFLKQANKKLLDAKVDDPALHHLIWLAAQSGQGSLHLLSLVDHADPRVRAQTIRALTEFPEQLRDEPIFTKALLDEDPRVQHAAMSAFFHPKVAWGRPMQFAIERGPAVSHDSYLRQTAAMLLAQRLTRKQIEDLCSRFDPETRLAGVLAAGFRLTLPAETKRLGDHLPLMKFNDEPAYVIEYADGKIDLRDHGRLGTFTIAQHWKADKHTEDENLLFKLLRKMADDRDMTVRDEAARVLTLLGDR